MAMAVFMVVHANVSLRGAAKSVAYFARLMNWTVDTPNHVTVLRWVLRAGLYQLQESARERTGRFAAIMDESISLGGEKLLLTLGVRLTDGVFDEQRPLSHQDVEVLAMQISPSWMADGVANYLEEMVTDGDRFTVDYFITDGGPNLCKALRDKAIDRVSDCTHVLMNLVKKQYADHELLRGLCRQLGSLRRQTLLGRYGVLAPPTLRDKDRFLRIFDILDWVTRVDDAWQDLDVEARRRLDFLKTYRPLLAELSQVRELVSLTGRLFKTKGLSRASIQH